MDVSVSHINYLYDELHKIEKVNLRDINFFEDGKLLEISKKTFDDFEYTGLNNRDFILTDFYKGHNDFDDITGK